MKKLIFLAALVFSFAANAVAGDADSLYAKELLKPGEQAPDFILRAIDGSRHSLSELKGNYVVLDFWASWCPDCRKDMTEIKRLHGEYGQKVKFVGISFDYDLDSWQSYVRKNDLQWLHLSELKKMKDADISKFYKVKWIPTMYLINPEGNVILSTVMVEKLADELKALQ